MKEHSHSFSGATTYDNGHIHHYGGVTTKATSGVPHAHNMEGKTSYYTKYTTRTGPAIQIQDGRHYHRFETRVEIANGHIHYIQGFTSAD